MPFVVFQLGYDAFEQVHIPLTQESPSWSLQGSVLALQVWPLLSFDTFSNNIKCFGGILIL